MPFNPHPDRRCTFNRDALAGHGCKLRSHPTVRCFKDIVSDVFILLFRDCKRLQVPEERRAGSNLVHSGGAARSLPSKKQDGIAMAPSPSSPTLKGHSCTLTVLQVALCISTLSGTWHISASKTIFPTPRRLDGPPDITRTCGTSTVSFRPSTITAYEAGATAVAGGPMQPPSIGSSMVGPSSTPEDEEGYNSQDQAARDDRGAVNGRESDRIVAAPASRRGTTRGKKLLSRGRCQVPRSTGIINNITRGSSSDQSETSRNDSRTVGGSQQPGGQGKGATRVAAATSSPADLADISHEDEGPVSITSGGGGTHSGGRSAADAGATGTNSESKKVGPDDRGGRVGGGAKTEAKKAAGKQRSQRRATAFTKAPRVRAKASVSLRTEDDIQGMVDRIKSCNPNNGGGRQAKGGLDW